MHQAPVIPEVDAAGLRQFAFVFGGIVAVLFGLLLPWLLDHGWPVWPWALAGGMALWGLVAPRSPRPVYRGVGWLSRSRRGTHPYGD